MKKWIYNVLLAFFAVVFLGSSAMLVYYFIDGSAQDAAYNALSQMREDAIKQPATNIPVTDDSPWVTVTDPDTGEGVLILPEFFQLYGLNHDLVGWLTIPGTKIDYPVLQKPEGEDYYLRRDYYGKKASAGSIYVAEPCDVFTPSDNVTIYGHMMRNGTMFADLSNYSNQAFFEEHPYILIITPEAKYKAEVFSAYVANTSYNSWDTVFDGDEKYMNWLDSIQSRSYFNRDVEFSPESRVVTLSTCTYEFENARFVVHAILHEVE